MSQFRKMAIIATGMIALAGCAPTAPPANTAADEAAVHAVDAAWFKANAAGDADAKAVLYAEDGVWAAPGAPAARGRAAIAETFKKDAADAAAAGLSGKPGASSDVGVSGDLAWSSGTYTVTDKSGTTVDAGKYLSVLKRKDGKWQILRDMYNSDAAPPAAAAAPAAAPAAGAKKTK